MSDEQKFIPVDINAPEPLPDIELANRVRDAMSQAHEDVRAVLYSENYRMWNPTDAKNHMREARQNAIRAWNEEQLAKQGTTE
jgi:hypothetical protein